jgi:hypothetical protein
LRRRGIISHTTQALDNAYWAKASRTEVVANQITAPDGTLSADLVQAITGSTTGEQYVRKGFTGLSGVHTTSAFVKKANWRYITIRAGGTICIFDIDTAQFTLSSGVTTSVQDYGDGWYRISVSQAATGATDFPTIGTAPTATDVVWSTAPASNEGVYVWGMQYEAVSFPTSYISTSGSTATRAADVASIPTSAFGYNQKAGTVVVEHQSVASVNQRSASINDGTSNNAIQIVVSTSGGGSLVGEIRTNATGQMFQPSAIGITAGQNYKIAMAYAENDAAVSRDGTLGTDSSVVVPAVSNLVIGAGTSSFAFLNGHIKSIQYYPRRLTNAQLQELTS